MFKNIGKALAVMLSGAGGGRPLKTKRAERAPGAFGVPYAETLSDTYGLGSKPRYTGVYSAKRTTAAAQKRAAKKRANKRKNPKGSK